MEATERETASVDAVAMEAMERLLVATAMKATERELVAVDAVAFARLQKVC